MSAPARAPRDAGLLARLLAGERPALARAITAVENETPAAAALLDGIRPRLGRARVVGVTGPPGAGKSTLVGVYVAELRRRGLSVAVAAVDPSSPVSGGAILGDRIRMAGHNRDPGVFVRSLAARGHLGGLSRTTGRVVDLMAAAGYDQVVVETVGAGQSEVEIAGLADIKLVVLPPGLGDEVQAIKAGILEIADILVVNKADLDPAGRTAGELQAMTAMLPADRPRPAVLSTVATTGAGIAALVDAVAAMATPPHAADDGVARARALIATLAARRVADAVRTCDDPGLAALIARAERGEITLAAAAAAAIEMLRDRQ